MKLTERKNTRVPNWELARITASSTMAVSYKSKRPCQSNSAHGATPMRYTLNGGCVECARKPRKTVDANSVEYTMPGKSRGNCTKGASRRGNRRGRSSDYPPGTVLHLFCMRISDLQYAKALYLGGGNASLGVRKMLESVILPADIPPNKIEAHIAIADIKAEGKSRYAAVAVVPSREAWDDAL